MFGRRLVGQELTNWDTALTQKIWSRRYSTRPTSEGAVASGLERKISPVSPGKNCTSPLTTLKISPMRMPMAGVPPGTKVIVPLIWAPPYTNGGTSDTGKVALIRNSELTGG